MTTELALVDTNVLVYSFFRDHPLYPAKDFIPSPELEVLEPPSPSEPEAVEEQEEY